MNTILIPLPSGKIVNLATVAFMAPGGANEITIFFAAAATGTGGGATSLRTAIKGEDLPAFISGLKAHGVDVKHLTKMYKA